MGGGHATAATEAAAVAAVAVLNDGGEVELAVADDNCAMRSVTVARKVVPNTSATKVRERMGGVNKFTAVILLLMMMSL